MQMKISSIIGKNYNKFWNYKGRYRVIKGGRGSKKSTTAALWYIYHLLKYPEANLLCVRRYFNSLKDSCYAELKRAAIRLGVEDKFTFNISPLEIIVKETGQKIIFRGFDNPDSITSITVSQGYLCWVWIEEAYTPEKLCNLMLTAGDKAATTYIWYSAYSEGVRKKLDNPRLHADRITRRSVAGRGIGELPLMQKSKVIQAIAPFQVEVSNSWEIMKEKGKQGDLIAFLLDSASAWALNSLAEFVFGDKVIPDIVDIISDMIDKFKDDEPIEKNIGQATLRAGGGIMSAMPYASVIASAFIPDEELRSEIFGDDDPSRYGVGVFGLEQITNLAVKGIAGNLEEDDIIDFAASYVLPMGGKQIARSYKGYKDISAGGSYTNKGQLRFPITTTGDKARTLMFGAYSTKKGQEYLEKLKPLGDKQTKIFKQLINLHNGRKYQDEIFYTFKGYSEYKKDQGKTILSKKDREKYVNTMSPLSDMPESEHIREWFINNVDSQEKTK